MQRKTIVRLWGVAAVAALVAGACSSSRGSSSTTTAAPTATTAAAGATTTAAPGVMFGTLPSPCGKGTASGATDRGITDTAIRIATGDDRGFAAQPGLLASMGDATKAMVKWCNDQGGINGRQIQLDYYDGAITQENAAMQQACKVDFMFVGEGYGIDDTAEQTRVGCNMAAVPGFTVGPNFSNGPMQYNAVPNPDDYQPASLYYEAAQLFPDAVKGVAPYHTTLASTETSLAKDIEAMKAAGWNVLDCGVKISYTGEPDYKPFAQKYISCGAKAFFINAVPGPTTENFFQAMDQLGAHPLYFWEASGYTTQLAQWNTQGLANNVYVREAFQPLENAAEIPAVQQYLTIVKAIGGTVDQLGEQSASSFLLWATEAKACGSNLTRQCMINNLSKVHSWTGGGLHAQTDPGNNVPPKCGLILKLTGTTWSQFYPKAIGQYDCQDKYLFKISPADYGTTIGPDRIATTYLGPNIIKPQS